MKHCSRGKDVGLYRILTLFKKKKKVIYFIYFIFYWKINGLGKAEKTYTQNIKAVG